jgi:hypothetical protein
MAFRLIVAHDFIPLNAKNATAMNQKITITLDPQLGSIKSGILLLAITRDIL